jgi:hypothetical protein
MQFTRSRVVLILMSVLFSAGLWVFGVFQKPVKTYGSYAVMSCGETVPDELIRERLERIGVSGIVSESGQWVFLDCFGSLERIPLGEYSDRVLPFDPRNDGYAEKLRSMFIRDGRRFVYFPAGSTGIHKRLESALDDIPHSVEYVGDVQPGFSPVLLGLLFCVCAGLLLIFNPLRRMFQAYAVYLIPCLPALLPFALGGAAGFGMAALLAGFAVFAAQLFLAPRRRPTERGQHRGNRPGRRLLLPFFLAGFGVIVFLSDLPALFPLLAAVLFLVILIISLHDSAKTLTPAFASMRFFNSGSQKHRRFVPVQMIRPKADSASFAFAMIPFTAAALALAIAVAAAPRLPEADLPSLFSEGIVTEADFYRHYNFQSAFSYRSLHNLDAQMGDGSPFMSAFALDADGLPIEIPGGEEPGNRLIDAEIMQAGFSFFPPGKSLWKPAAFSRGTLFPALLSAALPLFFIIPALVSRKRKRNQLRYQVDRRITQKEPLLGQ